MKIVKKNNRRFLVTRLCPFRGGFAFFFCIVVRHEGETERNPNLINHECIHFRQQRELLWIPFILIYFFLSCSIYSNYYMVMGENMGRCMLRKGGI